MFLRTGRLRTRIIILFAAIAIITSAYSGLAVYRSVAVRLEADVAQTLATAADAMVRSIEADIAQGNAIDSISFNYQEMVMGNLIPIIFSAQRPPSGIVELPTEVISEVLTNGTSLAGIVNPENDTRYSYTIWPIRHDDQVVGGLAMVASLETTDALVTDLFPQLSIALALTLFAIAGAGLYIGGYLTRVLGDIERVANSISQGQYDQRVIVNSEDEIGRLSNTINDMAAKLAALSQAQAQFFSKVSHELRTPLTIVKGFAITLMRRDDIDEQLKRPLAIIDQQTDNLVQLVDELIEFARLDVDQLVLKRQDENMAALIETVVTSYNGIAKEKAIDLRLTALPSGVSLFIDPQRIRQVLQILLDNAFKYTESGGTISVEGRDEAQQLAVSVIDSGFGIPEDKIRHVFERFYQLDTTQHGMGLGLALAQELIQAHRGTITAHNNPGTGLSFYIYHSLPD